ncbi:CCN family member 1-like [Lissotriton helveticus]
MDSVAVLLHLLAACMALVSCACPKECTCPPRPPRCAPGVSLVLDSCGCCKTCAGQLNDDCSRLRPCDHHKGLECNVGADPRAARGICRAKQEGRSCEYNGRMYQNGENFQPSCKHQCTCIDGAVGCSPLCPQELPLNTLKCPHPRLVSVPGQCCKKFVCLKGPKKFGVVTEDVLGNKVNSNELIYVGKDSHWKNMPAWRPLFESRNIGQRKCLTQTTEWSSCSKTCGMGLSTRVTNNNPMCKLVKETRLCTIRPCSRPNFAKLKKGKKCLKTHKPREPIRYTYAGCKSVQRYQPNFCGTCIDDRCCVPQQTRTVSVRFRCHDGDTFSKNVMTIQSCKCGTECGHLNEASQPNYQLYGDMHKFNE